MVCGSEGDGVREAGCIHPWCFCNAIVVTEDNGTCWRPAACNNLCTRVNEWSERCRHINKCMYVWDYLTRWLQNIVTSSMPVIYWLKVLCRCIATTRPPKYAFVPWQQILGRASPLVRPEYAGTWSCFLGPGRKLHSCGLAHTWNHILNKEFKIWNFVDPRSVERDIDSSRLEIRR